MRKLLCFVCLITFAASDPLTEEERKDILDYHNQQRSNVDPTASDMMELTYNVTLENLASKWVNRCEFKHPNTTEFPEYKGLGQNLAMISGSQRNVTALAAGWHKEYAYYHFSNNSCDDGKLCGHYTQMVWAKTTEIGCGIKACNGYVLFACQYKPPGNYVGERPYKNGTSCSACPEGTHCVSNLCSRIETTTTTSTEGGETEKTTTSATSNLHYGGILLFIFLYLCCMA